MRKVGNTKKGEGGGGQEKQTGIVSVRITLILELASVQLQRREEIASEAEAASSELCTAYHDSSFSSMKMSV